MSCSLVKPFPVGSGTCRLPKQRPSLRPSLTTCFPGALSRRGWRAKMIGPDRPKFVLFGSSIVQFSFGNEGWGALIADLYSRKADVILRGYSGWNSRQALGVVDRVFLKDSIIKPSLAIVYFGGNDSMLDLEGNPSVPVEEFINNMREIALHIKSLSETTRCIFLSPPPVNSEQIKNQFENPEMGELIASLRTMENLKKYSEALIQLCREIGIEYVDLFNAIQKRPDWLETSFTDGVHFAPGGSRVVADEIVNVLNRANWIPSLASGSIPDEFGSEGQRGSRRKRFADPLSFEGASVILD